MCLHFEISNRGKFKGWSGMGFQDLKETQEDLGPEPVLSGVENIPVPWCW